LAEHYGGQKGIIIGRDWPAWFPRLENRKKGTIKRWYHYPPCNRDFLHHFIVNSKHCACIGDEFYYMFHSLTARPFEGMILGALPLVHHLFQDAPITQTRFTKKYGDSIRTDMSPVFQFSEPIPFEDRRDSSLELIKSTLSKGVSLAEYLVEVLTSPDAKPTGSFLAAYDNYLNFRFSKGRLASYPMEDKFVERAHKYGEAYHKILS